MVHGLEKFKEYFGDYTNQYVFIGGTACDILMDELGALFRATKDLDMVLIVEVLMHLLEKFFGSSLKMAAINIVRKVQERINSIDLLNLKIHHFLKWLNYLASNLSIWN
jgi:hypothetical protein